MSVRTFFLRDFIRTVVSVGLDENIDLFQKSRIVTVNLLSLVVTLASIILIFINLKNSIYLNVYLGLLSLPLILLVFYLTYAKKYRNARVLFINFMFLISLAICTSAYKADRFTDTENIFYFLMILSAFLFDGILEKLQTLAIVIAFYAFKIWRIELQNNIEPLDLVLVNISLFFVLTYIFLLIFKDSLKRMVKKLEYVNAEKDKLFNIVTHDMRKPISNFEMMLNASIEGLMEQKDFEKFASEVKKQIRPLKGMIDELLLWSVNQLDGLKTNPTEVNLDQTIQEVVDQFKDDFIIKNIELQQELSVETAYCDRIHLKIIIRNIVHNAIKYSPSSSRIIIKSFKQDDRNTLEITDEGRGMTDQQVLDILNKKTSSNIVGTSGELGAGVGMKFCTELINKNKGKLSIKSEVGNGTSFILGFKAHEQSK